MGPQKLEIFEKWTFSRLKSGTPKNGVKKYRQCESINLDGGDAYVGEARGRSKERWIAEKERTKKERDKETWNEWERANQEPEQRQQLQNIPLHLQLKISIHARAKTCHADGCSFQFLFLRKYDD